MLRFLLLCIREMGRNKLLVCPVHMFERKVAHIHEFSFAPLVVVGFLSIFSFHLEVFWCPSLSREAGGKK